MDVSLYIWSFQLERRMDEKVVVVYQKMYSKPVQQSWDAAWPETTVGERRQPWRICQASSAEATGKIFPSTHSRCMRRPQDAKALHAGTQRQHRWTDDRLETTPRREAAVVGERPAKERGARAAGGKKLDGLEHSVHAVLATTTAPPAPDYSIITTTAQEHRP